MRVFHSLFRPQWYHKLSKLINWADKAGLGSNDLKATLEFIEYNEGYLAFDTLLEKMYENHIEIDSEFYDLIQLIAETMKLPVGQYAYMKELIRSENIIPKSVKNELVKIMSTVLERKSAN